MVSFIRDVALSIILERHVTPEDVERMAGCLTITSQRCRHRPCHEHMLGAAPTSVRADRQLPGPVS
jgi:hypothetical protein